MPFWLVFSSPLYTLLALTRLHRLISHHKLALEQIESYLASGGEGLEALRQTLREDEDLRAFASTPLMLNVLTAAFQGTTTQEIVATGSPGMKQEHVFASYVQRTLARRKINTRFTPTQTIHWLSWLARQMRQHNQTVFYMEQMQEDWLSENQSHRMYEFLADRIPDMLIGGIIYLSVISLLFSLFDSVPYALGFVIFGGFVGGLIGNGKRDGSSIESNSHQWRNPRPSTLTMRSLRNGFIVGLSFGLIYGLSFGWPYGLSYGLGFGLVSYLLSLILEGSKLTRNAPNITKSSRSSLWRSLFNVSYLGVGLSVGMSFGLGYVLSTELAHLLHTSQSDVIAIALAYVLNFTLTGLLLCVILERRKSVIQPAEIIFWSWKSFARSLFTFRHLITVLFIGIFVGLISGLSEALRVSPSDGLIFGLYAGLVFGLCYWLLFGLFRGISSNMLDAQKRVKPNQGIWRSVRNGIFIGIISGLVSWAVCSLSYALIYAFLFGLSPALGIGIYIGKSIALLLGLSFGLLCGLLNGGLAWIQHGILRLLLWRVRSIPWNYPQFLDYASERILLRKLGGGYMFIHRLFLEYFDSFHTPTSSDDSSQLPSQQS
jgi:hypothetical protein